MKSIPITFITPNSIDKYLLHASQMHIHAYIWRVHDSEPYSSIQGQHEHLWTLMDPDMYMRCVDIFPYYSLSFLLLLFPKKTLSSPISSTIVWQTFPIITASCMTSLSYILLFSQHSPVIYKDFFPLIYMYKSSRYYTVFYDQFGSYVPLVNNSLSLETGSTAAFKLLAYIASVFLVLTLSPFIAIYIHTIFAWDLHLLL